MSLKITLTKGEKIIINGAVIVNSGSNIAILSLLNKANILRGKSIMKNDDGGLAASIYYAVQCVYIFPERKEHFLKAAMLFIKQYELLSSHHSHITKEIILNLDNNEIYKALKNSKTLLIQDKE